MTYINTVVMREIGASVKHHLYSTYRSRFHVRYVSLAVIVDTELRLMKLVTIKY